MADPSKTERATAKKRRDERKKGHIAKSQDVIAVVSLIAAYAMLQFLAPTFIEQTSSFMQYCMEMAGQASLTIEGIMQELLGRIGILLVMTIGIFTVTVLIISIATTMYQTKMLVTTEPLKPKLNKLNPIEGFKRLFSLRSVIETAKNLLKIILLLWLICNNLMDMVAINYKYMQTDLSASVDHIFHSILTLIFQIIIAFGVLAVADIFYQKWEYERQMRMTKQEVKDEYKQLEGDPKVKGKIRERQQQMARMRMMQQVPHADVVIKNPTHYAVALRYRPERDNAPVVLAMGQDELALRIIKVAETNHVAVVENIPLARALYANAELGREIPPEFYGAVAEVLVYIFRLNNDKRLVK